MIDMHSHIVFDVDDGASSIDQSIEMIRSAKKAGFDSILLTSHYMEDGYRTSIDTYKKRILELNEKLSKEEVTDMKLYMGNEVMISPNLVSDLENKLFFTLNNSRYILMELPLFEEVLYLKNILFELKAKGYVPIIAHPERYFFLQKDLSHLHDILDMGALLQLNAGSILGFYGTKAKRVSKYLLKNRLIHFIGSDAHSPHRIYDAYPEMLSKIKKVVGEDYLNLLTKVNPKSVIDDELIATYLSLNNGKRRRWL